MTGFLFNLLRRVMIYQVILFWIFIRSQNIPIYANEFKDKVNYNLEYFDLKFEFLSDILINPQAFLTYFLLAELIFSLFAILGLKIASFFSGIIYLLITFIYFNPKINHNKIEGFYGIKTELVLNLGVIFAIFLDTFSVIENKQRVQEDPVIEVDDSKKTNKNNKKGKKNK